jgi:predicted HAD superfamily Cof-like phosphohydrolase
MFRDVKKFHKHFGHSIGATPKFLDPKRMANRLKWQDEERVEFDDALAIGDLAMCADAIADQIYFLLGHAVEMGLPMEDVWDLVHKANMNKARHGEHDVFCPLTKEHETPVRCTCGAVKYKEDGKTAKPEMWESPDDAIRALVTP